MPPPLPIEIQQDHQVQRAQGRQLPRRLIHENSAAVHWRADGIRRKEKNIEPLGVCGERYKTVAKISPERPAERFSIWNGGPRARAPTRKECPGEPAERSP